MGNTHCVRVRPQGLGKGVRPPGGLPQLSAPGPQEGNLSSGWELWGPMRAKGLSAGDREGGRRLTDTPLPVDCVRVLTLEWDLTWKQSPWRCGRVNARSFGGALAPCPRV